MNTDKHGQFKGRGGSFEQQAFWRCFNPRNPRLKTYNLDFVIWILTFVITSYLGVQL
ncbi:MAG: hypothetical protein NTZ78_00455 [Candidatus Aureabacteria bacterium]|nr:hypothetical protein [Candidatus Auribacterota bacterium]